MTSDPLTDPTVHDTEQVTALDFRFSPYTVREATVRVTESGLEITARTDAAFGEGAAIRPDTDRARAEHDFERGEGAVGALDVRLTPTRLTIATVTDGDLLTATKNEVVYYGTSLEGETTTVDISPPDIEHAGLDRLSTQQTDIGEPRYYLPLGSQNPFRVLANLLGGTLRDRLPFGADYAGMGVRDDRLLADQFDDIDSVYRGDDAAIDPRHDDFADQLVAHVRQQADAMHLVGRGKIRVIPTGTHPAAIEVWAHADGSENAVTTIRRLVDHDVHRQLTRVATAETNDPRNMDAGATPSESTTRDKRVYVSTQDVSGVVPINPGKIDATIDTDEMTYDIAVARGSDSDKAEGVICHEWRELSADTE